MNFTELSSSVRPEIIRATQTMGYTEMTEIQQKAIPLMLAGHDMIAKAPTGTGKTVAFGIPILQKAAGFPAGAPKAVVLSPTRELAQQIAQDLTNLAQFLPEIRVVCVYTLPFDTAYNIGAITPIVVTILVVAWTFAYGARARAEGERRRAAQEGVAQAPLGS